LVTSILGPDGKPFVKEVRRKSMMLPAFNDMSSWYSAILGQSQPYQIRAQDPFGNHPWIFAAAMTSAIVASQAPYTIFTETEDEIDKRKREAQRKNRPWYGPRSGSSRRSIQRHIQGGYAKKVTRKGLEPDYEHSLTGIFLNPNPFQQGNQLFMLTNIWMAIRGECFWVFEDENGEAPATPEDIARIWVLSPDLFRPILKNGATGELVGWLFSPPPWMTKREQSASMMLTLDEILQFKFPNPMNPLRGMSKISAAANGIQMDLMVKDYNKAIIENGGDPGGILMYDADLTKEEEAAFLEKFEQKHKGAKNARRTAMLSGGFEYVPVSLSPRDIQHLETMKWNREEELAVMNVPPSVLGVTEFTNYATQLGQDKNFWDKNLLSTLEIIETAIDGSFLMRDQPDSVVGAFDYRNVEALRSGVVEKIAAAASMAGGPLHLPPRTAYEVVGLEVPEYDGDDICLITPTLAPLQNVIETADINLENARNPPEQPDPNAQDGNNDVTSVKKHYVSKNRKKRERHNAFLQVEISLENAMRFRYRKWVTQEKRSAMESFDSHYGTEKALTQLRKIKAVSIWDYSAFLEDVNVSKNNLKKLVRPLYTDNLETTYEFTLDDLGGIPVFTIDDSRIVEYFEAREKTFVNATPETLRRNTLKSLAAGLTNGETLGQLRLRVAQAYDVSASSAKASQIARTETANFMNGVRDVMFDAQGVEQESWSNAQDEKVRESHVLYGEAEPQERGFNYLDLSNKVGGILAYPGDTRCTLAGEVINCRCIKVPEI
jgi:phage portal protein BeeE